MVDCLSGVVCTVWKGPRYHLCPQVTWSAVASSWQMLRKLVVGWLQQWRRLSLPGGGLWELFLFYLLLSVVEFSQFSTLNIHHISNQKKEGKGAAGPGGWSPGPWGRAGALAKHLAQVTVTGTQVTGRASARDAPQTSLQPPPASPASASRSRSRFSASPSWALRRCRKTTNTYARWTVSLWAAPSTYSKGGASEGAPRWGIQNPGPTRAHVAPPTPAIACDL